MKDSLICCVSTFFLPTCQKLAIFVQQVLHSIPYKRSLNAGTQYLPSRALLASVAASIYIVYMYTYGSNWYPRTEQALMTSCPPALYFLYMTKFVLAGYSKVQLCIRPLKNTPSCAYVYTERTLIFQHHLTYHTNYCFILSKCSLSQDPRRVLKQPNISQVYRISINICENFRKILVFHGQFSMFLFPINQGN